MEFSTTFKSDFDIADKFGISAIRNTYTRAFAEWHNDYRYLTDLSMVLNHKIWEHWENKHQVLAELYNTLWETTDKYAMENLKGDQLKYYLEVTD